MRRVVAFLCLVELTSGILQGYYTPILTDIARHLGIHDADVNWFEAAQLMVSALAVPVLAKLGDMYGHKRILLVSTLVTAAASWGVALAPDFWTFLAAWSFQGFYVVWLPLEIALIFSRVHQLPDGAARTRRAAGVLVGALEAGVIAGALAAGALVEVFAGQLQLVLLVPAVAVSACWFAVRFGVPESRERSGGRVDTRGFTLLALGLLLITSGLTFMRLNGAGAWWPWALVGAGILVFVPFARFELRQADPLVDIRMLRGKSMWPVQLTAGLFGVSVLGAQAPLSTFARTDPALHGYGLGLRAGQVSIIIGVYVLALLVGALLYPVVTRRLTPRWTLVGAATLVGLGYLLFLPFHGSLDPGAGQHGDRRRRLRGPRGGAAFGGRRGGAPEPDRDGHGSDQHHQDHRRSLRVRGVRHRPGQPRPGRGRGRRGGRRSDRGAARRLPHGMDHLRGHRTCRGCRAGDGAPSGLLRPGGRGRRTA